MSAIDHGGPAFPVPDGEAADHGHHGLSMRDWFAGQALTGLCNPGWEADPVEAAPVAYRIADAMLAARSAQGGER